MAIAVYELKTRPCTIRRGKFAGQFVKTVSLRERVFAQPGPEADICSRLRRCL
jgi:hypothetical protein